MSNKELEISLNLSKDVAARQDASIKTSVQLTVRNKSRYTIKSGGTWSVKDESVNPPVIAEARFGQIGPGGAETRSVSLPTGFEWGAFKFLPEGLPDYSWISIHGGDNTTSAAINLGDPSP